MNGSISIDLEKRKLRESAAAAAAAAAAAHAGCGAVLRMVPNFLYWFYKRHAAIGAKETEPRYCAI